MVKRYSIMVMEYGSDHEVELCQVEENPEQVVAGAKSKTLMVQGNAKRRSRLPKYTNIRVVENAHS
jgi:hypothetical protein